MQEASDKDFQQAAPDIKAAERSLEAEGAQHGSAGSATAADNSKPLGAAEAAPEIPSMAGAATGSAQASAQPAEDKQQQDAASSAEPEGSAGPAQQSGPPQKQDSSAGGTRFTTDQRSVATALMVVHKRAMKDGVEAALAAGQTLVGNNPATEPLLRLMPLRGPLPAMQLVEQTSSVKLRESLEVLAKQCMMARSQPLEVFSRSMHSVPSKSVLDTFIAQRKGSEKPPKKSLVPSVPGWAMVAPSLHGLGVMRDVACLIAMYVEMYKGLLRDDSEAAYVGLTALDYMLPGCIGALLEIPVADLLKPHVLIELEPAFRAAIRAWQDRAAQSGQSAEHLIELQGAVHGWTIVDPDDGSRLLNAIVNLARPSASSRGESLLRNASQAAACAAAEDSEGAAQAAAEGSQQAAPDREAAERSLGAGTHQQASAGPAPASDDSRPLGAADAAPEIPSMAGAPTGSARASAQPAESKQQQKAASSAKRGGSAGPAQQAGLRRKQDSSAGGTGFNAGQKAVAAALMVVVKRAMNEGVHAAVTARLTLAANNAATKHMLGFLQPTGPIPEMKLLEMVAFAELRESLDTLYSQCRSGAASFQPLEVFTRSVQCPTPGSVTESIAAQRRVLERRRSKRGAKSVPGVPSWPHLAPALHELGVQQDVAILMAFYVHVCTERLSDRSETAKDALIGLHHMLPGCLEAMGRIAGADLSNAHVLITLQPAFRTALQAYQDRAAQSGQSVERLVMLQGAVHGWSTADDSDLGRLLPVILKAASHVSTEASEEPKQASVAPSADQQASQGVAVPKSAAAAAASASASQGKEAAAAPAAQVSQGWRPDEQEVATALLVVLRRALKEGRQAMNGMKQVLIANNPETAEFLQLVRDDGELPSLKQLEGSASPDLRESLGAMAEQCAAAGCQPLEVFTRSAMCTANALVKIHQRGLAERQLRLLAFGASLTGSRTAAEPSASELLGKLEARVEVLAQCGIARTQCDLMVVVLHEAIVMLGVDRDLLLRGGLPVGDQNTSGTAFIDHILPGVLDALVSEKGDTSVDAFLRMVPPLRSALAFYEHQAHAAGQTCAHRVMLEAAVQSWPITAEHCTRIINAIIAAMGEDPGPAQQPSGHGTPPAVPAASSSTEAPPEQESLIDLPSMQHVHECPRYISTFFTMMITILGLSRFPALCQDPTAPAPDSKQGRTKAFLDGMLPGVREELHCAVDRKNLRMCPGLVKAAGRHVESIFQVLMSDAQQDDLGFSGLVARKLVALGMHASELPTCVIKTLFRIEEAVEADAARLHWHRLVTDILAAMHDIGEADNGLTVEFWLLTALAQLIDIHIYSDEATATRAERALMRGITPLLLKDPGMLQEPFLKRTLRTMREVAYNHVLSACSIGQTLRAYHEETVDHKRHAREPGAEMVVHMINILVDRVGPLLGEAAAAQEGLSPIAWKVVEVHYPEAKAVMESALMVHVAMGKATYVGLCRLLPGLPGYVATETHMSNARPVTDAKYSVTDPNLMRHARLVQQQIRVYVHLASVQKLPFRRFIEDQVDRAGVMPYYPAVREFCKALSTAAAGIGVDVVLDALQAKKMHISICIKAILHIMGPEEGGYVLVFLDKLTDLYADYATSSQVLKAIRQAFPSVMECLMRLHKWPHGLGLDMKWFPQATRIINRVHIQHVREAREHGVSREEHIRTVLAVPGLEDAERELLMSIFTEMLVGQRELTERDQATQVPVGTPSASPDRIPADSSTGAEALSNKAMPEGSTAGGSSKAAEGGELSPPGKGKAADVAADMAEVASSKKPADQAASSMPQQDLPEEAQPQSGLSEAEKAERRKAKKARQRAARAEAAAQTAQAAGSSRKEPVLAESTISASAQKQIAETEAKPAEQLPTEDHTPSNSVRAAPESRPAPSEGIEAAFRQEQSADTDTAPAEQPTLADLSIDDPMHAASESQPAPSKAISSASRQEQPVETDTDSVEQPPVAEHSKGDSMYAAPGSQPEPSSSAQASQTTASKRSPIRPQPSRKEPNGTAHFQHLEVGLPWLPTPAAQEEEPWQEVRKPRRKPSSQQAASPAKAGARKAAKEGRVAPVEKDPALSPARLRESQTASQHSGQPRVNTQKAVAPPQAQSVHAAAEQLPDWLTALLLSQPQQPLQSARPQDSFVSMQHEPSEAPANGHSLREAYMPFQEMLHTDVQSKSGPHEQASSVADLSGVDHDEEDLCIVCWENLREVIFYNCMHMCTCRDCARDIMAAGALCPMCRAKIQSTITARF